MGDVFTGQIVLLAFAWIPPNFLPCDGRILPVQQYSQLFQTIGAKYGGNGSTTFAVPNTSSMSVVEGFTYAICTNGVYPQHS